MHRFRGFRRRRILLVQDKGERLNSVLEHLGRMSELEQMGRM